MDGKRGPSIHKMTAQEEGRQGNQCTTTIASYGERAALSATSAPSIVDASRFIFPDKCIHARRA